MLRRHRKRFEIAQQARYLTFSCYRRLPLFGNAAIKRAFVESLAAARQKHRFRLLAWVIMPEHLHLVIVPDLPAAPIPTVLRSLKQSFGQRVINRWIELNAPVIRRVTDPRGIHHFWQRGGGYDRNLHTGHELLEKIAYVNANPVRRGLVDQQEEWEWSSARWYAGQREGTLPIDAIDGCIQ